MRGGRPGAVALEAVRILKAIGARPRRTIRVALWGGEEQGLYGSQEYVRKHFGNPKEPKNPTTPDYGKFSAYFNQDYGAGHTNLDFLDTLSAEDLMKNAVVEAAFVYQAAMADERVPRKPLIYK